MHAFSRFLPGGQTGCTVAASATIALPTSSVATCPQSTLTERYTHARTHAQTRTHTHNAQHNVIIHR